MKNSLAEPRPAATPTTSPEIPVASRLRRALALALEPPRPRQRALAAMLAAALAIAAAVAAAELAAFTSYSLIVAGVLAATWYGGLRFGLAATACAAVLSWVFIAEPRGDVAIELPALARLIIGIGTAAGASYLLDSMRRARQKAEVLAGRQQSLLDEISFREARLSTLADALPVLISYVDADRRYGFNNRGYEVWFGHDRAEIYGRHLQDVLGDQAYEGIRPYVDAALSGERVSFESLVPYKDAGTRWVQADYVPEFAPDGSVRGFFALIADQTERKRAEQELSLSEERYRSLAEATTSVVWTADPDAQIVEPQPNWERFTGQRWPDYRGAGFITMVHPDDREALMQGWRTALAERSSHYFPARVWHAESQAWHHCDTFAVPLKAETGEVREWIGTTNDVEDRYHVAALEHLRAADERARVAEAAGRMGMWEWDLGTGFIWSQGLERVYGVTPEDVPTSTALFDHLHPEDRARTIERFQAAGRDSRDIDVEFRAVRPDGEVRWLYARGSYLPETATHRARMVGITMDITERVETREALARALARSSDALALVDAILDTTPVAVALFDREMRYIRVNAAAAEINGLSPEEHLGRRLEDVLPGVGPAAAARYRTVWETGKPMPVEEIAGETPAQPCVLRWWDHSAVPVRDSSGKIVAVAVIFNEVTARKRAEQALRESEQRERFLSGITAELISSFDAREILSKVVQVSVPQMGDLCALGLLDAMPFALTIATASGDARERELAGRVKLRDWWAYPGARERVGDVLLRGEPVFIAQVTDEWTAACAPSEEQREIVRELGVRSAMCLPLVARGKTIGVATFATMRSQRTYSDADLAFAAEVVGRVSIIADNARLLTELVRTAEHLRHANAAKDEFLGLVSHELKTPITTIIGNAEVLRRKFTRLDAEARTQALDDIYVDAGRLQRLIDNMLILARLERGHKMDMEPVILPRVVERVVEAQRRRLPDRTIEVRVTDGDALVLASADYVEQVVNNLISNAEKYSPHDAPIEVTVERVGDEVLIDVLDRGAGIAPEESEQIFDPFYRSPRTAGRAPGVGVGLAVCKRVIEVQHGRLWARPRPGGGSDFGFALPVIASIDA